MDLGNTKNLPHIQIPTRMRSQQHTLGEVLLLVAVIGLSYWFIVSPKKATLNQQSAQLTKLQDEQKVVAEQKQKLQRLIDELKSHPKDVADLDEALPLDGKTLRLTMLVNTLAESSNVTVGDINFSADSNAIVAGNKTLLADPFAGKRTLKRLLGGISATGNYEQLRTFLNKIEDNSRIMNIISMDLGGSESDKLSIKLDVEAYYYE